MITLFLDSTLGEINIAADESDSSIFQINSVGEQIDEILVNYLKSCISNGDIRAGLNSLHITISVMWASICGMISLANKKEKYIFEKMSVTKNEFMQKGFNLLLRSILP